MATDCETLSSNARKIFEQLQPYFPPNPWKRPMWKEEGIVEDNGILDLRKSEDREKIVNRTLITLGSFVETRASVYKTKNGSLNDFEIDHFGQMIKNKVELLLILRELDFQIETMDFVD